MAASLSAIASKLSDVMNMQWTAKPTTLLALTMRLRATSLDPICLIVMQRGWYNETNRAVYLRLHGAELYTVRLLIDVADLVAEDGGFFVRISDDPVIGMRQVKSIADVVSMVAAQRAAKGLAPYAPLSKPEAKNLLALSEPGLEEPNLRDYAAALWRAARAAADGEARAEQLASATKRESRRDVERRVAPNVFTENRVAVQRHSYVPLGRMTAQRVFDVPLSRLEVLEDRCAVLEKEMSTLLRDNGLGEEQVTLEPFIQLLAMVNMKVTEELGHGID
jgi:hypothetical protein